MTDRDFPYLVRRLLRDALVQAAPIKPISCPKCGWPVGGTGKYVCLCGKKEIKNNETLLR